uniref:WW domain-containing protein n=1 Tax=Aplanochytrium stocchinoi TaxID=215587 RepID=A0A6S8EDI8_9STRA|eukprot:CAMPEP_0204823256 /NCGR_PEP_ID=MMETSP1346-20131115/1327_1 /ASSEMBLY_ACC=CAM_ASM_000771 /TAXON_ID=215587 /ORGANISM="Aplanochytrium stocchinoi, Strain GSBS06" /LENGTH=413 /DNA_ID=CAMNT_0051949823 /DNA_START=205 /DNA_END=1446 /DNA_ORIENTATION=+
MDAFKSVDEKNLNKVYRSDGQSDWMKWNQGAEGKNQQAKAKGGVYKKSRHTPAFPKLGTSTNTDARDDSNYKVGWHEKVLVPELETDRKKHVNRAKEHLQKEEEKERELIELKRKRQESQSDAGESLIQSKIPKLNLPPGWVSLVEPDTGKEYYFNQSTGETKYTHPAANQTVDNLQPGKDKQPIVTGTSSFILSKDFAGAKPGYVFKRGSRGVGYYPDTEPKSISVVRTGVSGAKISTTSVPDPGNTMTKTKTKMKKNNKNIHNSNPQQTYAASLMDVASNALSKFHAKQQQGHQYQHQQYYQHEHQHHYQQHQPYKNYLQPESGSYANGGNARVFQNQYQYSYGQQNQTEYARTRDANRNKNRQPQPPSVPPGRSPPKSTIWEWQTLKDPLTRKTYYLNTRTQETTFKKPF